MSGHPTSSSLYSGIFNLAKSDEGSADAGPSKQSLVDTLEESEPTSNVAESAEQKSSSEKSQGSPSMV